MPRFPAPALRLLLRDGTGTLEATLAGSDALLFLFGSPRLCEAPASPGQPAAPSQLGSDLTPLLDRLTGACSTTYVRIGGEGGEERGAGVLRGEIGWGEASCMGVDYSRSGGGAAG